MSTPKAEKPKNKGGRPKGAHGITRITMLRALQSRLGKDWDPVSEMAEHAQALSEHAKKSRQPQDRANAITALDKVANYLLPRLKQVEMDVGSDGERITLPERIQLVAVPVPPREKIVAETAPEEP